MSEDKYKAQHKYEQSHKEYYNQKGKEYYQSHKEEIREKNKEKWAAHREEYRQKKRDYYKNHKEEINQKNKEWARTHKEKRRINCQNYRKKLRLECLIHYSSNPPKCACCGESHIEFLAIDHIHGGGNEERRKLRRMGIVASYDVYRWLRKNGFPKGYQVLCHNCNLAKGFYGYCPHKEIKQ